DHQAGHRPPWRAHRDLGRADEECHAGEADETGDSPRGKHLTVGRVGHARHRTRVTRARSGSRIRAPSTRGEAMSETPEQTQAASTAPASGAPATQAAAKTSPAKKTAAKKSPAKKSPTNKTAAKKSATKKTTAKSTSSAAKKSATSTSAPAKTAA